MPKCECLTNCPFFHDKMDNMPAMSNLIKKKFCEGDNAQCARYMVFVALGPKMVPTDLFPTQIDRAKKLV